MLLRNLALASGLALAVAPAAAYADSAAVVQTANAKDAKAPQTPRAGDSNGYAEREQQDKQAAEFQGGDLVVVGISGGALVVLLLVLLILL